MVIPFVAHRQEPLPGMPFRPTVDVARVQRDLAQAMDEIRFVIAQTAGLHEKHAVWDWLRQSEDELRHLTDLAGACMEKALEEL